MNCHYKTLGKTGIQVSNLCLGTMTFGKEADEEMSTQIFHRAQEVGINFIDTANIYGQGKSEEIVGRLLRRQRSKWVISSKFCGRMGPEVNDRGASRKHIVQAIEDSLRRLQTDYLDLYFMHTVDRGTPIEETLQALDDLVRSGKILHPAASNMAAWQIMRSLGVSSLHGWCRFVCLQPMYNLVKRQAEVELLPMAEFEQLGVIPYSPLAAGLLTGKYLQSSAPSTHSRIQENPFYKARYDELDYYKTAERFCQFCQEHDLKPAATAVAWVSAHPAVTAPILGARHLKQFEESLESLTVSMTPELRLKISALSPTPPLATDRRDEQVGLKMFD